MQNFKQQIPNHVAIIMDGNGRWAKSKFMPRIEGHRRGANVVKQIVKHAKELGVKYLTLYAFSSENWGRPKEEVSFLMGLFEKFLQAEINNLIDQKIRIRVMGDKSLLPKNICEIINESESKTAHFTEFNLILAVSYGAREEILSATKKIAALVSENKLSVDEISEKVFTDNLYMPEIPNPELLIRTSGEFRISNFLLWQIAYSEIVIRQVYWPDFSIEEFDLCLQEFQKRNRRFGLIDEQIGQQNCSN